MDYKVSFEITKVIKAQTSVMAREIAEKMLDNFGQEGIISKNIDCVMCPIMDDSNAHDTNLVSLVNMAYFSDSSSFNMIVNTLAKRDEEECYEKDIKLPIGRGDEYDYLINVADDEDLKTIITFVRPRDVNGNLLLYKK